MFRQEEIFHEGWAEKTIDAMQNKRFKITVSNLPALEMCRLDALSYSELVRRIEHSWQSIEIKPLLTQQLSCAKQHVLNSIDLHADFLSPDEHDLLERTLTMGGYSPIMDMADLHAAQALSLRLWADIGLVSGKPVICIEPDMLQPIASAIARKEHAWIRKRLDELHLHISQMVYISGAIDDRFPHRLILKEVSNRGEWKEEIIARRYLWSSFDCIDYDQGVLLLHSALADPKRWMASGRKRSGILDQKACRIWHNEDILPEEIPLQKDLERVLTGAMRDGYNEKEVARNLRFLCKQGARIAELEEVVQSTLTVLLTPRMCSAIERLYYMTPKWIEASAHHLLQ